MEDSPLARPFSEYTDEEVHAVIDQGRAEVERRRLAKKESAIQQAAQSFLKIPQVQKYCVKETNEKDKTDFLNQVIEQIKRESAENDPNVQPRW